MRQIQDNRNQFSIRQARVEDAAALAAIYAPYVEQTAITFELVPPTAAEFARRIERITARYPYLVLEEAGAPVGYAYAGPFGERAAYDHSCEVTIYLSPPAQGRGLGRRLYEALEAVLRRMGICNLYACIAVPERDDAHLTHNSAAFHAHLGYRTVGTFRNCGCKFGRWYHMIWMEKLIGAHASDPKPVVFYKDLPNKEEML